MTRLLEIEHVDGNGDKETLFINPDQIISLSEYAGGTRIRMSSGADYRIGVDTAKAVEIVHKY